MWGDRLGHHEYFRLPMFYIAAYRATENEHFFTLYRGVRDTAFLKSSYINEKAYPFAFPLLQMQYSLRLAYALDSDPEFRANCLILIKRLAVYGKEQAVRNTGIYSDPSYKELLCYVPKPFTDVPAFLDSVHNHEAYFVPCQLYSLRPECSKARWILTNIGDFAAIYGLCPEVPMTTS